MEEFKILSQIIADELSVSPEEVTEDKRLNDLGADSMDVFGILAAMEDEFKIEFDPEEREHVRTVGDLFKLLEDYA